MAQALALAVFEHDRFGMNLSTPGDYEPPRPRRESDHLSSVRREYERSLGTIRSGMSF
jgi:hypothetical protein